MFVKGVCCKSNEIQGFFCSSYQALQTLYNCRLCQDKTKQTPKHMGLEPVLCQEVVLLHLGLIFPFFEAQLMTKF